MSEPPGDAQVDSGQAATLNAAAWLRHWGHHDAQATDRGADGAVDVWSTTALARVCFGAAPVGPDTVAAVVAAAVRDGGKRAYVFSGAGFTAQAVAHADAVGAALVRYDLRGGVTPVNPAAGARPAAAPVAPVPLAPGFAGGTEAAGVPPTAPLPTAADAEARHRRLLAALPTFPRDQVRWWTRTAYEHSVSSRSAPAGGWWRRNWTFTLAGLFGLSGVNTLAQAASQTVDANPGGSVTSLVIAGGLTFAGVRRRRRAEAWRRHQAQPTGVHELPSEVADVVLNLPTVAHHGAPSTVAQFERVRAELDSYLEEGEFVTDALVWAYYVRPQSAGTLRDWVDSRPARMAQVPRGW